ncbi:UDP:flavonoid glycosyltransferase YjiC (YdhE family) [Catenulispora sp. GP43]|uniref:glycosyltransferase n=1 Tax=Catenulispora sp. GP43 TaxID=3156263 RepID=UPI003516AB20
MRILFSGVPAYGHLLPLVPLAEAALAEGHAVAVLTAAEMAEMVSSEFPAGVEHLAAGAMPLVFSLATAERTGQDVFQPTPFLVGEIFGGDRLDLAADEALDRARRWAPDLIMADAFDAVGPLLAAALDVPWHQVGLGPALPAPLTDEIARAAARRYADRSLTPTAASTYIDPCPELLQDPDWSSTPPRLAVRPQAHRRATTDDPPALPATDLPRVLITFGTIFSDPDVLAACVDAVRKHPVRIVATTGMSLREPGAASASPAVADDDQVTFVPFTPLDQLLEEADVVVGAGGSGTLLAALGRGLPLVLWPQGADQHINAARAAASGAAVVVESADQIADALADVLADVLADGPHRAAAQRAAAQIAAMPRPLDVLRVIAG